MYFFLFAVVIYHSLSNLNNKQLIYYLIVLRVKSLKWVNRDALLLDVLMGNLVPYIFQLLRATSFLDLWPHIIFNHYFCPCNSWSSSDPTEILLGNLCLQSAHLDYPTIYIPIKLSSNIKALGTIVINTQ